MASGLSHRFGSNKLLAEFNGKKLIEIILEKTEDIEIKRLVLTRTKEVFEHCRNNDIEVILHEYPNRNEAVRLGVEQMLECDACMFCTCDQPLLSKDSINNIISDFLENGKGIYRLSFEDRIGNPILFSKEYFEELMTLPEKKGGAYVALKNPADVKYITASSKWELCDVDTPDDLIKLSEISVL